MRPHPVVAAVLSLAGAILSTASCLTTPLEADDTASLAVEQRTRDPAVPNRSGKLDRPTSIPQTSLSSYRSRMTAWGEGVVGKGLSGI